VQQTVAPNHPLPSPLLSRYVPFWVCADSSWCAFIRINLRSRSKIRFGIKTYYVAMRRLHLQQFLERVVTIEIKRLWAAREERGTPEMFKNTFQSGFLSILYSIGSKPLQIWDKKVIQFSEVFINIICHCNVKVWSLSPHDLQQVRNGHIKRITDNDIQSLVLEIVGTNVR